MKQHPAYSLILALTLIAAAVTVQSQGISTRRTPVSPTQTSTTGALEGRLRLSRTQAVLDETRTYKFDPEKAQCFIARGRDSLPTTCATLVGVGYADRARVTVVGDSVVRLDILELQQ
jgi:hypothetical protein